MRKTHKLLLGLLIAAPIIFFYGGYLNMQPIKIQAKSIAKSNPLCLKVNESLPFAFQESLSLSDKSAKQWFKNDEPSVELLFYEGDNTRVMSWSFWDQKFKHSMIIEDSNIPLICSPRENYFDTFNMVSARPQTFFAGGKTWKIKKHHKVTQKLNKENGVIEVNIDNTVELGKNTQIKLLLNKSDVPYLPQYNWPGISPLNTQWEKLPTSATIEKCSVFDEKTNCGVQNIEYTLLEKSDNLRLISIYNGDAPSYERSAYYIREGQVVGVYTNNQYLLSHNGDYVVFIPDTNSGEELAHGNFGIHKKIIQLLEQWTNIQEMPTPLSYESSSDPSAPSSKKIVDQSHANSACRFGQSMSFPQNMRVYAAGGYKGVKGKYQFTDEPEDTGVFKVAVSEPNYPVALILGAHYPSVWDISRTPDTDIVAVIAMGGSKKIVVGLSPRTPVLLYGKECGGVYVGEENLSKISTIAQSIFNKPVERIVYSDGGNITFGHSSLLNNQSLMREPPKNLELFNIKVVRDYPAYGRKGINEYLNAGKIKLVSREFAEKWGKEQGFLDFFPFGEQYLITDQITIPEGLSGAHSVIFYLEKGAPYPRGDLGHSMLFDLNTMGCYGIGCKMLER